jgi:hypothetical protein
MRVRLSLAIIVAPVVGMLLLPVGPSAGSPKSGGRTEVVCLNDKTFNHEYKFRPKHCIFHKRHSPNAEAFFVRTKHDHWSVWNRQRARGKGKAIASMVGPTPVKISLSKPVQRCGHRVFSRAHFRFTKLNSGGGVNIDTCA